MRKFDEISLNDTNNKDLLDKQSYQDYLKKERSITINNKHIKKFLSNNIYYLAVKQLTDLERIVFYLSVLKSEKLDTICKLLHISRKNIVKIKKSAIKHFIENVRALKKDSN